MSEDSTKHLDNVARIDDERIKEHLVNLVRDSVEETSNALLDAEAAALVGASRYERTTGHREYGSGHYERKLGTSASDERALAGNGLQIQGNLQAVPGNCAD